MKRLLTTCLLMFGMLFSMTAQNAQGEIKGTVYDELGDPMIGASVYVMISGEMRGTQTDVDGKFTIKPLSPGTYDVNISYIGYQQKTITGVAVSPDKITWLKNNTLAINSDLAPEVKVIAWKNPLIKPEDPTAMTVLSAELETRTDIKTPVAMISNLSSEIQTANNGRDLIIRGARADASGYYVDGVKMATLQGVPGGSIGSVTVYTGGIPAKYGDLTGGVVVLESKSYFDLYREANKPKR